MEEKITTRKKGVKTVFLDMQEGESMTFPRKKYSSLNTTKTVAKIENPERDWSIAVVPDGIVVTCLK